ncbi:MAG TPA: ATP-dependent Clp protease proteolytic subunit [Puia sp.]|nr:ATP-dependent Clp protease proteolytic subunit [Puia sp.]
MPDVIFNNQYWMYTVDPEAEEPVMLINTHIGYDPDEGFGCMGDMFQRELLQLDALCIESNKKRIQVWINSPGGIVEDGMSIYSAILKTTTKVDTICVGLAASIAGVIFQAGRTRIMSDYAYLMYHNPYGSDDDKGMAAITDMIVIAIAARTGKPKEEIIKLMNKTSWIGADEAVQTGLADKIEVSGELNKKRAPADANEAKNFYRESRAIVNKLTFKNTTMADQFPFARIANKLGLHEMASADAIMEVLSGIMNKKDEDKKKAEDLEDAITKCKRDMDDLKKEHDDLKKKHADLKAEYDEHMKKMEDKKKAEEEDRKKAEEEDKAKAEDKAKNLVDTAAAQGKIPKTKEALETWKNKAIADYAGVESLLKTMGVSVKASGPVAKPETGKVANLEEAGKVYNMATEMAVRSAKYDEEFRNRRK